MVGIPVAEAFNEYLLGVISKLKTHGVRAEIDDSDDRMQKKIRNATAEKVPFMLIAGADDQSTNAVSFRFRDGSQRNNVPVEEAVGVILSSIQNRTQV